MVFAHRRARPRKSPGWAPPSARCSLSATTPSPRRSATAASTRCGRAKATQITEDHTLISWQMKQGLITRGRSEAIAASQRHHARRRQPRLRRGRHRVVTLAPGDRFLLCSDGLHGYLREEEIPSSRSSAARARRETLHRDGQRARRQRQHHRRPRRSGLKVRVPRADARCLSPCCVHASVRRAAGHGSLRAVAVGDVTREACQVGRVAPFSASRRVEGERARRSFSSAAMGRPECSSNRGDARAARLAPDVRFLAISAPLASSEKEAARMNEAARGGHHGRLVGRARRLAPLRRRRRRSARRARSRRRAHRARRGGRSRARTIRRARHRRRVPRAPRPPRRGRLRAGPARAAAASRTRARACSRARSRWTSSRRRSCFACTTCRRRRTTPCRRDDDLGDLEEIHGSFGFPVIVKPRGEGSSLGVTQGRRPRRARRRARRARSSSTTSRSSSASSTGNEVHVGILDGRVLGAIEIAPKSGIYDYEAKYTPGMTEYFMPARLPPTRYRGRAQPRRARRARPRLHGRRARRSARDRAARTSTCSR